MKSLASLLLFIVITLQVRNVPIAPRKVIYAVDCGGLVEVRSAIGVKFRKVVLETPK